ncbi:MAG: hypothetical protein IPO34_17975 [Dehalococcoidia bacterium]|nr:hypothetical protein [Dehalococcoidia bacterium]
MPSSHFIASPARSTRSTRPTTCGESRPSTNIAGPRPQLSVAQTDVKGDRSAGPQNQPHPDYYTDRRAPGRWNCGQGAKIHTSCTTNVNELIVLPTRAMSEADKDYALAFAIPVNTPG